MQEKIIVTICTTLPYVINEKRERNKYFDESLKLFGLEKLYHIVQNIFVAG